MVFVFVTEQLQTALHQYRRTGDKRAVPRAFDEATELQHAVEVFLSALSGFNLGHQDGQVVRTHTARRTLPTTLILEKFEKCSVLATMHVASSTTIIPAEPNPVPAFSVNRSPS